MLNTWLILVLSVIALTLLAVYIYVTAHFLRKKHNRGNVEKDVTNDVQMLNWLPSIGGTHVTGQRIVHAQCVAIQPRTFEDLQKSEEKLAESTSSSADGLEGKRQAKLKFTLQYNIVSATLAVKLLQAKNLHYLKENGHGDVAFYVTTKILPLSHRSFQSSAVQGELHPKFDDFFEFSIAQDELLKQNLKFTVCYFDRFSHHDSIGELSVDLYDLETRGLSLSREVLLCREINAVPKISYSVGEIMLSLGYLRLTERLAVVVIAARNLPPLNTGQEPDPYVEVILLHSGRRLKDKKTCSRIKDRNPTYNESLTFHIPVGILHQSSLLVCLMHDAGTDGDDVMLGQVLLGPETTGVQFEHWNEMRVNNKPVARWHKLHAG